MGITITGSAIITPVGTLDIEEGGIDEVKSALTLPGASLLLLNKIVFVIGDKPYICVSNSESPTLDSECFWVAMT